MPSAERTLDWPAVRSELAARGVELPPDALPFWFGNDARMARELGAVVAAGTKRATAGLVWAWEAATGNIPVTGQVFVVLDWNGRALAVIRLTEVRVLAFDAVDADFAALEGEGGGSLAWWRDAHWKYFSAECQALGRQPAALMPVVCQTFELLWSPPC